MPEPIFDTRQPGRPWRVRHPSQGLEVWYPTKEEAQLKIATWDREKAYMDAFWSRIFQRRQEVENADDNRTARRKTVTDPQDLLRLLRGQFSSLTIGYNDESTPNYQNVAEWEREEHFDRADWASDEERELAILNNSAWTIQWYPDTPIGSCRVVASTFEAAAQAALATLTDATPSSRS